MTGGLVPAGFSVTPSLVPIFFLATTRTLRRGRVDIIATILGITADGGMTKTHLQYRSNLDSRAIKRHVADAIENGLLLTKKDDANHDSYHLTEKGEGYLRAYEDLQKFLT